MAPLSLITSQLVNVYLDECLCNLPGRHEEINDQRGELLASASVPELTEVGPVVLEVLGVVDPVAQPGVELHPTTEVN